MTKEEFKEILTTLLELKKDEEALDGAFKKFDPDFNGFSCVRYEILIVNTLKIAVNDKDEWIEYFLYERDGKFTKEKIINDKDGKNLPFRNMDDLYSLIVTK